MIKEKDMVQNFMQIQEKVLQSFQCEGEFFIKPLLELEWAIRDTEDFYFLSYWTKENKRMDAVIVKKKRYTYGLSKKGVYNGSSH